MDWANAGLGFKLAEPPASSTRRNQPPSRSAPAPRKSQQPRQRLLRPVDSVPLVTPRPSSSAAPRPTHTQSKLSLAPPQRPPLADKRNRRASPPPSSRDSNTKAKGRALVPDSDDSPAQPAPKPGWLSSMFGRAPRPRLPGSSSASSSTPSSAARPTNLGRAILHPVHPRRGPTIDWDGPELAADDDELFDEDARRKRRRTEDRGGFGRLDLCDEDVHAGFGTQLGDDDDRVRRTKRSLEMDAGDGEADVKPRTGRDAHLDAAPQHITLASSSSPTTSAVAARSVDDDDSELEPEPSTASSGSSAKRDLQAQLVPPLKRPPRVLVPDSDPLGGSDDADADELDGTVSDDDREDELDALVQRLGGASKGGAGARAGVDDSGFAEVSGMDVERGEEDDDDDPAGERDETPSPGDLAGPDEVVDLTVVPSSSPLVSNAHELLGPPRPSARPPLRPDADSSTSTSSGGSGGSSLGRTASGILMPPPALPRKRLRRGAPSTRAAELEAEAEVEAQARARVLVEDTQVRSPNKVGEPRQRPAPRPFTVVCDETQTQLDVDADLEHLDVEPLPLPPIPHYRTLPRLPRPPNLAGSGALSSPAVGGLAAAGGTFLSSDPDHLPPLPTPRPLAVPLSPSPARPAPTAIVNAGVAPHLTAPDTPHDPAWASLASAWAGARPPSPGPPRQTLLGDFFAVVPASQACATGGDEGELVEDSQVPLGAGAGAGAAESALEEALRRQKAVNLARERGVGRAGAAAHDAGGVEQAVDEVLEVEVEEDEVPDSDPEDDAPALSPSLRRTILLSTATATSTLVVPPPPSFRPLRPTAAPTSSSARSTPTAAAVPGPPSPLGTPIRKRFPRYSPGKLRLAVERWAGAGGPAPTAAPATAGPALESGATSARDVFGAASAPVPGAVEGEGAPCVGEGGEQGPSARPGAAGADETQWESYWSYPASSGEAATRAAGADEGAGRHDEPAYELEDDDDDDDDEESLALPPGWTRSARGELVRVPTPAATARADVSVELGEFEDETLAGW
ncbi:uncharacterized protein RHOBADRAFT_51310 [Rhodotorula graminis WP1]|uniref:Proteophosphoglycan ppg4 n=1 Tax=Rhodotorula graminis (strain WP1) TaxID=578459 RepID=A0A194SAH4_RHOGW|nr:uncharacterized protein RHOBADRAFT_51310 [Rhodotorula graminis WP1]KPV77460.1 hypothetical protein RHOBADRAFT_51310 [Rhodotorula graminis WP1]